ncbi:CAF1 family ribonuclease [Aspergillus melleus]|uniref:CAF1 family ribonuclease n=1 Tax=Aspergillus melleus TaxID=138277 RepID=UPI001E8DBD79|nr:uncharacterized protein LDX57_007083 [Aspergillus melleus]KAH8429420.1 hypothetical protein LDX57_007083 [Aspergillus melleus]
MDITAGTFAFHLPRLLDDLATCHFVSIDCEFSGIPTTNSAPSSGGGKPTLQQRYDEYRKCTDKYRIVQIGLTVGHEDIKKATYTLRPYNLYLNPNIDQKLDVERDISFQSSAMEFLLQNQFSLNSLYNDGVRYLSREEEDIAMAKASARFNRTKSHAVMEVKETEHDSIEFVQAVRKLVKDWLALGKDRESYLNIPPPSRDTMDDDTKLMPSTLNNYRKRLVHQLIEVEYPSLVTISHPTFIQIIEYDEAREKAVREQRMKRTRERISQETGFRWVAEALAGGDLSRLDPYCFRSTMSTSTAVNSQASLKMFSEKMKQKLQTHRPVLVGHNLFVDLVYFCRCFFGPLPESVQDFQSMVHKMFPVLVDTKYLATHNCGSIIPRSSLSEINEKLLQTATPKISQPTCSPDAIWTNGWVRNTPSACQI